MAQHVLPPPESYAALFGAALPELPGARHAEIRRRREASFARFHRLGFPGPKAEAWKYTPVGALIRLPFSVPAKVEVARGAIAPYLIGERGAVRLVFINGHFAPELSDDPADMGGMRVVTLAAALEACDPDLLELAEEQDPARGFSALNDALAADGCFVDVLPERRVPRPLQLLFVSTSDAAPRLISPRNVVRVQAGAELNLVETHVSLGAGDNLTNLVSRFVVGQGATLNHDRLQIGATSGSFITRNEYELADEAQLTQTLATLGGGLVRNEVEALLDGSRIEMGLNGLYFARERQHVDNALRIVHARPNSHSDQFYKGVLDGHAHAVFAGQIVVRRPAQGTNAYQANNNLLLSPDAEIDTKPELEIFADDVKCSHGATAGELDERELFYLRSRGLDRQTARSLMTYAFAGEVLERIRNPSVARLARREVLRWLPGGAALGELT